MNKTYMMIGLVVLGFVPWWVRRVRVRGGWRQEIKATFWSVTITRKTRRNGQKSTSWTVRVALIEKLRDVIWAIVSQLGR